MNTNFLIIAGVLSFIASLVHLCIIFGGPNWYRFFGAGEHMAVLSENKSPRPAIITAAIATVLFVWALYAWSGAGILPRFPLLKFVLVFITGVYMLRGIIGFIAPYVSNHPAVKANSKKFWFWSSAICLMFGAIHLFGLLNAWNVL